MKKVLGLVGLSLMSAGIFGQGCVSQSAATIPSQLQFQLDPELSTETQQQVETDLQRLVGMQLTAADGSFYAVTFGGTSHDNVLSYLNERVHYLIPEKADLDARLKVLSSVASDDPNEGKIYTMATNIGTLLWFESIIAAPHKVGFEIGSNVVPLDSSRNGIVRVGEGWTAKDNSGKSLFPQFIRLSTLVHEARHSDCTGGVHASDLASLMNGGKIENHACGHLHVQCPEGHDYAGAFACDGEAWGAYSVEGIYSATTSKSCTNCSDSEKKLALVVAADALSRVLVLDDMIAGKLGLPDMSSSTNVIGTLPASSQQ